MKSLDRARSHRRAREGAPGHARKKFKNKDRDREKNRKKEDKE